MTDSDDGHHRHPDGNQDVSAIPCDACRSALRPDGDHAVSVLLLDQLTVPLAGCDDHLEEFTSICGLTTEDTADLLEHRPAGGIRCPGCRVAPQPVQSMIPLRDGAVAVMACAEHQTEIMNRFQVGLETYQDLTTDFGTTTTTLQ